MIIYGPPGQNLAAPATRALANSGWQYEGKWGTFTGTPIAANYFVTAGHIGGSVGQAFEFNGADFTTSAFYDDPTSDLRIWKIDGAFPAYAPLYLKKAERGKQVVVFGRGTERGTPVVGANKQLKGWRWGRLATDAGFSWGTNTVARVQNLGPAAGDALTWTFDARKSNTEAALSFADSGGGVFVKDGKTWKLAGVNLSVDGPFSLVANPVGAVPDYADPAANLDDPNSAFNGAILDKGGLYSPNAQGGLSLNRDVRANQPSSYFATRISSHAAWINAVLAGSVAPDAAAPAPLPSTTLVPEPVAGLGLVAAGLLRLCRRRRRGAAHGR